MTEEADPVLSRLVAEVGRWRAVQSLTPPGGGVPVEVVAVSESRLSAGGRLLVTEHRQAMDGEPVLLGHSVTTPGPVENTVIMYFFDGSGEPPAVYRGRFEGEALVLEGGAPGGARIRHRTAWPSPGLRTATSSLSADGGTSWEEIFSAEYHRED